MKALFVGDTHGNIEWWERVVVPVSERVGADVIVQVGDLGYWAHLDGEAFRAAVAATDLPVYFIDGNHEHHDLLAADVAAARLTHRITDTSAPVPLGGALLYLPRGARFQLGPVRFCALGGAVSIDRETLTPGSSWFPDERIAPGDVARTVTGGPADVLVCHDAPSGWAVPAMPHPESMSAGARTQLLAAAEHRMFLREAYEAVRPAVVIHGHYHSRYRRTVDESWGRVVVEGLDCDGTVGAFTVMECSTTPELRTVSIALT